MNEFYFACCFLLGTFFNTSTALAAITIGLFVYNPELPIGEQHGRPREYAIQIYDLLQKMIKESYLK